MALTVGQLIDHLKLWHRDTEITFGSNIFGAPLEFYRVNGLGDDLVQIELNELFEPGTYRVKVENDGFAAIDLPR